MRWNFQLDSGSVKLSIHADNDDDRKALAILARRGRPDEFECLPYGSEEGPPYEAEFYWGPRDDS